MPFVQLFIHLELDETNKEANKLQFPVKYTSKREIHDDEKWNLKPVNGFVGNDENLYINSHCSIKRERMKKKCTAKQHTANNFSDSFSLSLSRNDGEWMEKNMCTADRWVRDFPSSLWCVISVISTIFSTLVFSLKRFYELMYCSKS